MASVITVAFENWKAQEAANGKAVLLDEFVFANVPNLDPSQPIDRNEKLPPANQIVHRQAVNKAGLASENAVAYSVTLGADVGNFDFNWIGLLNKASGTVAMITHAPTQKKLKNQNGQQGNVLTRSFILEFQGAAEETQIKTSAETWQIDFTARLSGIDEMQRLINVDSYGAAAFFNDGFEVTRSGEQYTVKKGLGYVGGLRGELVQNQILNGLRNTKVYADFSYQGNIVSQWNTVVKITSAATLNNYVDAAGFTHQVFAIASVDASGNIKDLRPIGTLSDRDIKLLNDNKVNRTGDSIKYLNISSGDDYSSLKLERKDKSTVTLESKPDTNSMFAQLYLRDLLGKVIYNLSFPKKTGVIATLDDILTTSYFDNIYLRIGNPATSAKKLANPSRIAGHVFYGQGEDIDITPKDINAVDKSGDSIRALSISSGDDYPKINLARKDGAIVSVEAKPDSHLSFCQIYKIDGNNQLEYAVSFPKRSGTVALEGDSHTKAQSNDLLAQKLNRVSGIASQFSINDGSDYTGLDLIKNNGKVRIEARPSSDILLLVHRDNTNNINGRIAIPIATGTMALKEEVPLTGLSYKNVLNERVPNTVYRNSSATAIVAIITYSKPESGSSTDETLGFYVNGSAVVEPLRTRYTSTYSISIVIPGNAEYSFTKGVGNISSFWELR
ncbi:phage tail-collar fiber domain-containing protein [Providencia rettgeri]|uniref:phage tail-collar fiber domain-containing protein n=1 Tax=Providencia rettgeri TaxID=587 RepID=UPI0032EBDF15